MEKATRPFVNELEIVVRRRGLFPRAVHFEKLLLEGMDYGVRKNGKFIPGMQDQNMVIAYREDRIGRGIAIGWVPEDPNMTMLSLSFPTSDEELDDFFLMTAHLAHMALCEVYLNEEVLVPSKFNQTKKFYHTHNLQFLHKLMGEILNSEDSVMNFGCAFHDLTVGIREADRMWAGVNTDVFRDWMHELQKRNDYYADAQVSEDSSEPAGIFTVPSATPVIFPSMPGFSRDVVLSPARESLGAIRQWLTRLTDSAENLEIGTLEFREFLERLPREKVSYYDAMHYLIEPLSIEELRGLLGKEKADAG